MRFMHTAVLVLVLATTTAMTACFNQGDATGDATGEDEQGLRVITVCDPISGECHNEVDGTDGNPTVFGGPFQGFYSCVYDADTKPGCGAYDGFLRNGDNASLAGAVMLQAIFDVAHFNNTDSIGWHIDCSVTSQYGDLRANCTMHQGPWHWYCEATQGGTFYCHSGQ